MRKYRWLAWFMLAVAASGTILVLACGDDETGPTPSPWQYEPTEPKYVLANIVYAYNHKDAELLALCLTDDYDFYFDPSLVGQKVEGYTVPESWHTSKFMSGSENAFAEANALEFALAWEGVGKPGGGATKYEAKDVATDLRAMDDYDQGQWGMMFEGAPTDFKFKKVGDGTWRLSEWEDRTAYYWPDDPESTFGWMLAWFYAKY